MLKHLNFASPGWKSLMGLGFLISSVVWIWGMFALSPNLSGCAGLGAAFFIVVCGGIIAIPGILLGLLGLMGRVSNVWAWVIAILALGFCWPVGSLVWWWTESLISR
jgi:hypothetical protein